MRPAFRFILAAVILALASNISPAVDLVPAAFDQANKLFDQGKYADAASAYQEILKSHTASSPIYFNLGNSYFKAGQIGRAVAAYRQAERLAPRDPDLRANLQFARNQAQGPTLAATRWQQIFNRLSLNEWTVLAATAGWVLFILLAIAQVRPAWKPALKNLTLGSGLVAVILAACLGIAWNTWSTPLAIVVVKDVPVRQGPLEESPEVFKVHDGAELRVLDHKDNWLQVTTDPRRIGWVKKDQVLAPD